METNYCLIYLRWKNRWCTILLSNWWNRW